MQTTDRESRFISIIAIMVLVESASIMSTDLYTPSLPDLVDFFASTPELLKLTISINVMAYGAAQIFYGPLADRFGRRPVILAALALFVVSSLLCALARSIDELLVARVLQGIFASAGAVICLTVFRDLFDEQQQIKAFALYGMAIALTPAVAPILGGYIHIYLGWEYNFYLTAAIGVFAAVLIRGLLPESGTPDPDALHWRAILRTYWRILRNRRFHTYAVLSGFALGMIYCFITAAPFILIEYLGVAVEQFGYCQAVIVVAYFSGATLTAKLVDTVDATLLLNVGIVTALIGGLMVAMLAATDMIGVTTMVLGNALIAFGLGPIFSVAPSRGMSAIDGNAGSTASLFGFIEIGLAGVVAAMLSVYHDGTALPYAIVVLVTAVGSMLLGLRANRLG